MKPFNRRSGGRSSEGRGSGRSNSDERSSGRFGGNSSDRRGSGRFSRESSDRRGSGKFGRESSGRRESSAFVRERFGKSKRPEQLRMYEVICDKCGQKCEVPFKPTSDKPVYCSECFKSKEKSSGRSNANSEQLDEINEKLDRILKALHLE